MQYNLIAERITPDRENLGEYARDFNNELLQRLKELRGQGCFVIDFKSYYCGRELKWFYLIVYEQPTKVEK